MQHMKHAEDDAQGIQYRLLIEVDDIPVEGNASASGNETIDREVEDKIRTRLDNGETWAWCRVKCQAVFRGFTGSDSLGGCSYTNTDEFVQPGGYWKDMKDGAKADLLDMMHNAKAALEELGG